MKTQSFIWTCLPNGVSEDSKSVLVSVLLSPRLDPGDQPPVLASFDEWLDWPAAMNGASVEFFAAGTSIATRSVRIRGDSDPENVSLPDSRVWTALFRPELEVHAHSMDPNLLASQVLSYSATDMHELVRELYKDLATRTGGELPRIGSDLLAHSGWRELVDAVTAVDCWGKLVDDRLDPRASRLPDVRDGENSLERRYAGLGCLLAETSPGTILGDQVAKQRHLARFELFHTPPLKPKPPQVAERDDDARITVTNSEFERSKPPDKQALAATMHFQRIVAAMNAYPTLQRRLGLVLDFSIEREALPALKTFPLRVKVSFRAGALSTPQGSATAAITRVYHSDEGFFAESNSALDANATRVQCGLLDQYSAPDQYTVLQADVDGAGLKLMNFARTLGGYQEAREKDAAAWTDEVSRKEKVAGAPALRTAGLMLVQRERAKALKNRLAANRDQKDAAAADVLELFAEDLTRGYRIDIWDTSVRAWRSLCRRRAEYLLDGEALQVLPERGEEEGAVQLAATRSPAQGYNPQLLNLHEAMVSWTGWSLAAPQPGYAISTDDSLVRGEKPELSAEAELPPGIDFRSRFKPVRGSLPRLRYGRSYDLRARAVDLAGNSLPPRETNFGPERPDFVARPFLRFEPVLAPVLALARPLAGVTQKPAEGESMARMAIRSFNEQFDDATPTDQVARRYAVPPQSTAREAELHGMLDADGVLDPTTFEMLAREKDRDAHDPAAALVEEQIPLHGPLDPVPVDTTFAVWKEGSELSYLPDPLAEFATACFIHHPTLAFDESVFIPLYTPGTRWPDAKPFRIELFEAAEAKPTFDKGTRVLRVPLGKGDRATLRLSMRIEKSALREKMGIWQWLDASTQKRLEGEAVDGRQWMFTPFQDIELVHAVQRPLRLPELEALHADREDSRIGATSVRPRFYALCSLKSTDRLDLLAEWHEPVDDPSQSAPSDRKQHDLAFHVKITETRDYTASPDARPDHAPPEPGRPDRVEVNSRQFDMGAKKFHEFNDTRYRRIEYRLVGTTRYREYLPAPLPVPVGETRAADDNGMTVEGKPVVTWVKNSAPPIAPQVLYVVPTFGWTRTRGDDGTQRSWRRGGGLRVYLDRPWNTTGYGEMLAVVLPPPDFDDDPNAFPAALPYKHSVTQWGSDPIWDSAPVVGVAPTPRDFPLARFAPDPSGSWLPPDAPQTEAGQAPGQFGVTRLPLPSRPADRFEIAPHDVFFDEEHQLWYADIEIDMGRSYWPFVRLALARYQPTSVDGAHLSDVVLADVMQLTAHRWLTVRPEKAGLVRNVTVHGFGYHDSAGAQERRDAGESAQETPISSNSVVEVFLEQLDPTLGEDFGWHRIATGTRARPAAPAVARKPSAVEARLISPEQRLETARLLKSRKFATALGGGAVERLFVTPELWDGKVTLPSPADGARLRIAVEEYEEYPIDREPDPADGKEASSPIRTRTGRRLVFVEHIELA